ncbi:hypothetical protein [Streptomyces lydicus]|uniref:hypothetical protein n=1 Tax=Streptomyces lydicus TaxID=47763 RepID=UPI00370FBBA5
MTVLAAAGCDDDSRRSSPPAHQHPATRGAVVSVIPVADLDVKEVAARVAKAGIDATQVRYGVRADRIVSRTVDFKGKPITARAFSLPGRR